MISLYKTLLLLFLLLVSFNNILAVEPISFITKTSKNGLSNNYIQSFIQDSYGFVWIASYDGLNCYDGSVFKTYYNDLNDTSSIPDSKILCVFEDSRKQIWVGTKSGGIAKYDRDCDCFHNFSDQSFLRVSFIVEVQDGQLLLVTNNGYWMLDGESEKFTKINLEQEIGEQILSGIHDVLKDKSGNIWFGFFEDGIVVLDSTLKVKNRYPSFLSKNNIPIKEVHDFYEEPNGDIWITMGHTLLLKYVKDSAKIYVVEDKFEAAGFPNVSDIWHVTRRSKEAIWIGTSTGGIIEYNEANKSKERFVSSQYLTNSLSSNACVNLFKDRTSNIWIGTHGGGVLLYSPFKNQIKNYQNIPEQKNSLSNNLVTSFYEDQDKNIWIGTDGGGLNVFNPKDGNFKSYSFSASQGSNVVLDIEEHDKDNIWLSFWDGGVSLFNMKTGMNISYKNKTNVVNGISLNNIKSVKQVNDSLLFIATHGHGLNIMDIKSGMTINKINSPNYAYKLDSMKWGNELLFDSQKRLWCATNTGLYMVKDNKLVSFWNERTNDHSLTSNSINCVFEDSYHTIWVGTNKGLNRYNEETNNFTRFTKQNGFESDFICAILEDDIRNLWISTNKGIVKFSLENLSTFVYDSDYGVQDNEFYPRAALKSSDGLLYFGGLQGFNIIDPKKLSVAVKDNEVYISNLQVFYKTQIPNQNGSFLKKAMLLTDTLEIPWDQSVLTFEFISLNFMSEDKIKFRCQLNGFDNDWHYLGNQRKVTYTNLNPGEYKLVVQCSNVNGTWGKMQDSVLLIITPPWWKTWWFITLFIFSFFGCVYLFVYFRLYRIKRQKKELERVVARRTNDLRDINTKLEESHEELSLQKELLMENNIQLKKLNATKDRFFSIIAHDLKNPLSTLMSFSHLLVKNYGNYDEEKKIKFTKLIEDTSIHTYELLLNLLQWARSQTGDFIYNPTVVSPVVIVNEINNSLNEMLVAKEIEVHKIVETESRMMVDKNMMLTIMRNLMVNAIKYSPRKSKIFMIVKEFDNANIAILIKDQGIGMTEDTKNKIFMIEQKVQSIPGTESEKGTGLGLIVCKEFIDLNKGKILVESEKGIGSTFTIVVPRG
mgnify:CR=1 FL=1